MAKYYKKISDEDGNEFLLAVNITGHGAPTEDTEADPGMCYLDEDSEHGDLYKCIGVLVTETGTVYRWKQLAGQEEVERLEKAIADTVKTTAQELTEEQQNQARANIGVYHDTRVLVEKYINALSGAKINATADWNVGEEVVVFIDGVENKYTVQSATEEIEGELWTETYIGNNPFGESGDNGFMMCTYPAVGMVYIFNATKEPHTYGIYAMEAVKITDKYLDIKPKFNVYSSSYDTSEIPPEQLDAIVIQIPVMSGAHVDEEIVCSPSGNLHLRHDYVSSGSLGTIEINPSTFAVTEVRTFPLNDTPSSLSYLTVIDTSRHNKTTVPFSLSGGGIQNSSVGYISKYFLQTCAYINGYLFAFSTNEHQIGESNVAWTVDAKRLM